MDLIKSSECQRESVGRFYIRHLLDVKDELNRAYAESRPMSAAMPNWASHPDHDDPPSTYGIPAMSTRA